MIEIITAYCIYAIGRVFSGHEDGMVSLTEIELARSGRSERDRVEDTARRKGWHRQGLFKLIATVLSISIFTYGFSILSILMVVSLLNLQVIIFNPIINKRYLNSSYFHLAPTGWDGLFKKNEKLYYFVNLVLFAVSIYFQIRHIL